jgi:hypothetical protein
MRHLDDLSRFLIIVPRHSRTVTEEEALADWPGQ